MFRTTGERPVESDIDAFWSFLVCLQRDIILPHSFTANRRFHQALTRVPSTRIPRSRELEARRGTAEDRAVSTQSSSNTVRRGMFWCLLLYGPASDLFLGWYVDQYDGSFDYDLIGDECTFSEGVRMHRHAFGLNWNEFAVALQQRGNLKPNAENWVRYPWIWTQGILQLCRIKIIQTLEIHIIHHLHLDNRFRNSTGIRPRRESPLYSVCNWVILVPL